MEADGTMLRAIYSIILLAFLVVYPIKKSLVDAEATEQQQESPLALFVDTKYWIRNTEFGERDNWRRRMKPCTLKERIKMDESSVVSMGDSMDALDIGESNIKELLLDMNSVLLLEEDTLSGVEATFIQYLNESGDCLDSESIDVQQDSERHLFEFAPDEDSMSWFNPHNWALPDSYLDLPDSHRIPCSEDVVVFGDRHVSLNPTIESNERAKTLSFKVNFRASRSVGDELARNNISVNSIRVSKLKIGDIQYSQRDFERLINSERYKDLLFEFNSGQTVLKSEDGFGYSSNSLFIIDESSIHPDQVPETCLDEAGCLCGNENANVMKIICSFREPTRDLDQPCYDPIASTGYCDKICASVLTITMDPVKFKEAFLYNLIRKLFTSEDDFAHFRGKVFINARRTYDNKYELTFRHIDTENYETTRGRERELAQTVYETLNKDATKSFYGIKLITMKSSINWRTSNSRLIFWSSFAASLSIATIIFFYGERNDLMVGPDKVTLRGGQSVLNWFFYLIQPFWLWGDSEETQSFASNAESIATELTDMDQEKVSNIPLVDFDSVELSISTKAPIDETID